ncbi:MAG TPA: carbon-nitrogen hydrolase family protein [Acidimicrobiia bacterium]|nr:carbon-nitrogen hydrolase family protein [Acidimicrobiia bacterium]
MKLTIATCQFPTSADVISNARCVSEQIRSAKDQQADVVHFPECALSGYAGSDLESYEDFDWTQLEVNTRQIIELARELKIWVILGSIHRLTGNHRPHNSLYVINNGGEIIDRYDKRFCAGDAEEKTGDLAHYSPGNHFCVFEINGVKCGTLICHDYRYPELYREYQKLGVQLMFHSYHAGNMTNQFLVESEKYIGKDVLTLNGNSTIAGITQIAAMHASSSNNYMYISCPNTSASESCWGSFFVRPDGIISGQLKVNEPGVLISTIDTEEVFYDSTVAWRDNAMNGILHSGTPIEDKRSSDHINL